MKRRAGILAPVFSLPGRYGIGDFGASAYRFVDLLAGMGVRIWQVLPLNPLGYGESPYQPFSSFAGETLYIDLDTLYEEGLLDKRPRAFRPKADRVDYQAVRAYKERYFRKAYEAFKRLPKTREYRAFAKEPWVKSYAVFITLKKKNGMIAWTEWPEKDQDWILKKRGSVKEIREDVDYEIFLQYEFFREWLRIKAYANEKGILLMGDIPFYVGQDSLDVWANRDEFLLDSRGYPTSIAGVPPDYFSATGQRWGNPIYDWEHMKDNDFRFWRDRVKGNARLFDLIRIDHFRAFDTYWKIPASCPTAIEGEWIEAPGYELFDRLLPEIPGVEIIAEDLGMMRDEVYVLRDHYGFPGMNVLQFTMFDEKFRPSKNMIVYTGTHDNDTIEGFFGKLSDDEKWRYNDKLRECGIDPFEGTKAEQFVKLALEAEMETAIVPLQDLLSMGTEGRINIPGLIAPVNWTVKLPDFRKVRQMAGFYKDLIRRTGRA
ncbi:MAG: 4-alpha-glucanotransferase [Lachnospiraceae bacterium]|nr:4-alpha-glucanotransferase [Lachnospiraceae bacterium]MBR5739059.1 4-alpha-glucanotransferase [Lachnospiraceae bacterium]